MSTSTIPEQVAQSEDKGEDIGVIGDLPNPDALCDEHVGAWTIAALYQFRIVSNLADLRNKLQVLVNTYPLCGTLILAEEGINGTIGGSSDGIKAVHELLLSEGFNDLEYKESSSDSKPFQRMKLKIKKEIVTLGVPVRPLERVGRYLNPREWDDLLRRDDVVIVDTRNDYEYKVGTFRNAINPKTNSFADFPAFVQQNEALQEAKASSGKKKVAMFCTGGIRCEKSTSYMLQEGYDEVYHLKGGILKYLEETPEDRSLWDGECFVFDNRTCVTHGLKEGQSEICDACGWPMTPQEKSNEQYEKGVSCVECFTKTTQKQKAGFRMKQKQIELTEQRARKEKERAIALAIGTDFDAHKSKKQKKSSKSSPSIQKEDVVEEKGETDMLSN